MTTAQDSSEYVDKDRHLLIVSIFTVLRNFSFKQESDYSIAVKCCVVIPPAQNKVVPLTIPDCYTCVAARDTWSHTC